MICGCPPSVISSLMVIGYWNWWWVQKQNGEFAVGVIGVFNLSGGGNTILYFLSLLSKILRHLRHCARRSGVIYLRTYNLHLLSSFLNFILNIEYYALWRVCSNQFCAQVHQNNQINKIAQLVIGEILPIRSIYLLILYINNWFNCAQRKLPAVLLSALSFCYLTSCLISPPAFTRLWIHLCKVLMKSALCIQSVWSSSLSPPRCWCASCNSSDSWRHCMWAQLTGLLSSQFALIMAIESWGVSPRSVPVQLLFDYISIDNQSSAQTPVNQVCALPLLENVLFSPRVIPVNALMPCECLIWSRR